MNSLRCVKASLDHLALPKKNDLNDLMMSSLGHRCFLSLLVGGRDFPVCSTKWLFNKVNSMIVTFELGDSPIVGELERSRTHYGLPLRSQGLKFSGLSAVVQYFMCHICKVL